MRIALALGAAALGVGCASPAVSTAQRETCYLGGYWYEGQTPALEDDVQLPVMGTVAERDDRSKSRANCMANKIAARDRERAYYQNLSNTLNPDPPPPGLPSRTPAVRN